ncbi:MAG: 5-methyltetrahydropteroyltriglutamate--homocysteine S-methyltransferase [Rhodospirillales bacterium]|nr:5-methyltetrahydropteroyltriglutamate--homocysteine S-methyltransferase [Rhodospirillales bacterium]
MAVSYSKGPYRADHVGSLIRPAHLLEARSQHADGEISDEQLRAAEDKCIIEAVKLQEDGGFKSITDGELRRRSWNSDFIDGFENVVEATTGRLEVFHRNPDGTDTKQRVSGWEITGKVGHPHGIQTEDYKFLESVTKNQPKVCFPSPTLLHFRGGREAIDKDAYPEISDFFADVAGVYREEVAELSALGARYLQVDDTNLAYLCDPRFRDAAARMGEDPDALPEAYCDLINASISGRADDMTMCIHLCRGNASTGGAAEGGYEPIAEIMFNGLNVDGFFLEYDTDRAGDFSPLRFLPKGKKVVLGLVSTKVPTLETKDDLKRRIDEAAKFAPLDQLCLSPQCGFSSGAGKRPLTIDDEIAKIDLIVETAMDVWGEI